MCTDYSLMTNMMWLQLFNLSKEYDLVLVSDTISSFKCTAYFSNILSNFLTGCSDFHGTSEELISSHKVLPQNFARFREVCTFSRRSVRNPLIDSIFICGCNLGIASLWLVFCFTMNIIVCPTAF